MLKELIELFTLPKMMCYCAHQLVLLGTLSKLSTYKLNTSITYIQGTAWNSSSKMYAGAFIVKCYKCFLYVYERQTTNVSERVPIP